MSQCIFRKRFHPTAFMVKSHFSVATTKLYLFVQELNCCAREQNMYNGQVKNDYEDDVSTYNHCLTKSDDVLIY